MRKGQVSVDMIIVLAMALIIFGSLLSSVSSRFSQSDSERKEIFARDIAERIGNEINSVVIEGPGSRLTGSVPIGLPDSTPYQLDVIPDEQLISIRWMERHYSYPVLSANITGNISDLEGEYEIRNIGGRISIR